MSRILAAALAALLLGTLAARAQWGYPNVTVIGPGSTVQGDYLRGVGIAAAGLGQFEVDDAVAGSINTHTAITWNEYLAGVAEYQARNYALRREQRSTDQKARYQAIRDRISKNPDERDVRTGSALNALKDQLLSPAVGESALRYNAVPLPADVVRRTPFKLDSENLSFSMHRLTARGKEQWPPALQDPQFAAHRRAYERAVDAVLEQQIEGKMTIETIRKVEAAVDDLYRRLDEVVGARREKLFLEARNRLDSFRKSARQLFQSHQMELVMGELDKYHGTTVRDLLIFMKRNKLGFAGAESGDEMELYPAIFAALQQQRERLNDPIPADAKP